MKRIFLLYWCAAILFFSCNTSKERIPPLENNQPTGKIIIYQLLPRLFGNTINPTKPFGTIEENGVGKFKDISGPALSAIRELGVTHVWYAGILEHPLATDYTKQGIPLDDADIIKGRAGNPFVVKDYYDVDPDLAVTVSKRMQEFEQLVNRSHEQGLQVIIDFIPKQVARNYHSDVKPENTIDFGEHDDSTQSFNQTNNFYYLKDRSFVVPRDYKPLGRYTYPTKDGIYEEHPAMLSGTGPITSSPEITDAFDAVRLNYGVNVFEDQATPYFDSIPDTWNKMKDILLFWANKNVNGFYCHEADQVPIAFWEWIIPEVRQSHPEVLFIAGTSTSGSFQPGTESAFDLIQDNTLYTALSSVLHTGGSVTPIQQARNTITIDERKQLHYMEIHNRPRLASEVFNKDMWGGSEAALISATIDRGAFLIYSGQELGEPAVGASGYSDDNGVTTLYDYWNIPTLQQWVNGSFSSDSLSLEQQQIRMFYSDVLNLAKTNTALVAGDQYDLTAYNLERGNISDHVHVFMRVSEEERILIINGFSKEPEMARIEIPDEIVKKIGLNPSTIYLARDLIWREVEVAFDKDWGIDINIRPYTGLVLKVK